MATMPHLSETLRKTLAHAQVEARRLNQDYVAVEHLLLALLDTPHSDVSRALRSANIDVEAVRTVMAEYLPFNENPPAVTGDLPLSPKASSLIAAALVKSKSLREPNVTSRLLLLALLDDGLQLLSDGLTESGSSVDQLKSALASKPAHAEA